MCKKLLSILLPLALLLSLIPAGYAADIEIVEDVTVGDGALDVPLAEGNVVASGQCGENLFWTLDEAGTLTITGTGDMWNSIGVQGYGGAWSAYGAQIRTVIIEDGSTSIGAESFKNCDQITSVVIPDSLLTIDDYAFLNCSALESLSLGEGLVGIGSVRGIEFFPALTSLTCSMNSLTELDVMHNPALTWLDCFGNELTNLGLSCNPALEFLDCSDNSLTALNVMYNTALTSIDCSNNEITQLDVMYNPALEGLFCSGNRIYVLHLNNPALLVLDCSMNALRGLGLSGNPGFVMLECYGNSIAELDLTPCPTLLDIVTNGTYEQKTNYDSYTKDSYFVHVDPTTKLRTETFTVTLTDYTKGAAQTSIDFTAKYIGWLSFTVSADSAVTVAMKKGDEYTLLRCSTSQYENWFSLNVTEDTELVFAFKGDLNLDGTVKSSEVTMIKRVVAGTYNLKNGMAALAADVNGDGVLKSSDATMLARSIAGTYDLKW